MHGIMSKSMSLAKDSDPTPSIIRLATNIVANSNRLSWYLNDASHCQPSALDGASLPSFLPPAPSERAIAWRNELKNDALELFRLVSGPKEFVAHLNLNLQYHICMRWLLHFKILPLIPSGGSISYNNVAILAGVPQDQLISICRMVMTCDMLQEPRPGHLEHTATSLLIASDKDFAAWAACATSYFYDAGSSFPAATQRFGASKNPTHAAFTLTSGSPLAFHERLQQDPQLGQRFQGFLRATEQIQANDTMRVLRAFDWNKRSGAVVVDLATSTAAIGIELVKEHENLKVLACTSSRTAAIVTAEIADVHPTIASKVDVLVSDNPADSAHGHADVFLLRHMLHRLPEAASIDLLKRITRQLRPRGAILIVDLVLHPPGEQDCYGEAMLRARELVHKQLSNGKTRYLQDWEALVKKAAVGIEIAKVTSPTGSDLSLLEVRLSADI